MNDQRSASTSREATLEKRRPLLTEHLSRKDEGALITVANESEVRHFRAGQVVDDDEAFLDWILWWCLATVDLTEAIIERQVIADAPAGSETTPG